MTKSVITIEKEFFEDNGVQMVKRKLIEDGVTLCENTTKVSDILTCDTKLNIFERWIRYIKGDDIMVI
jgi:hypothetical protein